MIRRFIFGRGSSHERMVLADVLRQETVGGALLIGAALIALIWANSPWSDTYASVREWHLGPLSLAHWTADGLLAIFFFVAGLEVKRELVVGDLRRPSQALVPVAAAIAGMAVPALFYVGVVLAGGAQDAAGGWAIPTATDIAFALAVLAVAGPRLPSALRAFLLTLAVVDDLGAITVIAIFFTEHVAWLPLLGAIALLAGYAALQRFRVTSPLVYVPLALACWWLVYESGIHATVAGVALGLLTRVRPDQDEEHSPAERLEHRLRPLSAALAVPAFALLAAGVPVSVPALWNALGDPAAIGVVVGLVAGKTVGVVGGAWLTACFTRAELNPEIAWRDITAVAVLSGIGFTVALLVAELAFGGDAGRLDNVKAAILVASILAAVLATVLLRTRQRHYAALAALDA